MAHLKKLEEAQVVSFDLNSSKNIIQIGEECDSYFARSYNKKEFGEIIEELLVLHSKMNHTSPF